MNAHPLPEAPIAPELCTLDELFASEMDIWTSIRRLGKDVNKNALILQKWGRASSNEAVSDVMFHSANVLIKFSLALVQFSTHGEIIRNRLQAIRDVTNTPEHASQYKLYAPSPPGSSPDILLKADPAKICYDSPTIIRDLMKQKFDGMEELARKCNVLAYYGNMLTGELPSEESVSATLAYKGKDRTAEIWHEAVREATQPRFGYLASRQDDEGGSETNNYGSPTPIEFDSSLSSLSSVTQERNRRWAIIDEDIKLVLARAGGAAINARLVSERNNLGSTSQESSRSRLSFWPRKVTEVSRAKPQLGSNMSVYTNLQNQVPNRSSVESSPTTSPLSAIFPRIQLMMRSPNPSK